MWSSLPPRKRGVIQVLLSGLCFGFLGLFGKLAFAKGISPGELLSLRFLLGGALLIVFFLLTDVRKLRLSRRQIFIYLVLGVFGYAVFSTFYFQALSGLSASLTVLLLYTYPIFVAAGGWIFLGESIPRGRRFALPLALAGTVLLVGGDFEITRAAAFLFGLGSAVFYSVYILLSRRLLRAADPVVAVAFIQGFAGLALGCFYLRDPERVAAVVHAGWQVLVALTLVCSIGAMALFQAGLKKLQGWEASVLGTAEPIAGVSIAAAVLGERLNAWQIGGAFSVLVALVAVSVPARASQNDTKTA